MSAFTEPHDRWEPWPVDIHQSGGPERVYDESPKDNPMPPVGFAPGRVWSLPPEIEPLVWDGDNA